MLRHALPIAPLVLCACFRGFDSVEQSSRAEPPTLELEVSDQNASVWSAESAPRTPRLTLRASQPLPHDAERHVFLLRGTPTDETLEDLGSGALRESTAQQTIALEPMPRHAGDPNAVAVRPAAALRPGAQYTLLWADGRGSQEFPVRISPSPAAGAELVQSLPAA
ncbi:MAG TPA: hypothetical protein VFZ61_16095, partial [Polyangiales bacterium]